MNSRWRIFRNNLLAIHMIMKNQEDTFIYFITFAARRFDYYVDLKFWNDGYKVFLPIRIFLKCWRRRNEIKKERGKKRKEKKSSKNLKWFKGRFKAKAVCTTSSWCYYSLTCPSCLTSNLHARDVTGLYREWDSSDRIFTNEIGRFRFVFFPFVTREGERHRIPQIAGIRERERERFSKSRRYDRWEKRKKERNK